MQIFAILFLAALNQSPTFEVASVKHVDQTPNTTGGPRSTGMAPAIVGDPVSINYTNVSLSGVLVRAYDLKPNQIVGPEWLINERYNINARVPQDAPKGQIPEMLQNLLAERFQMKVHWETKDVQGYALTVAKSGPKLTKSEHPEERSFGFTSGHLAYKASTLDDLANSLTAFMGSPVVDMTEIKGAFDITLEAAPDSMPGMRFGGSGNPDAPALPSIFTAIHGLGLNLESRKVSVRHLVVDAAQKIPTEN